MKRVLFGAIPRRVSPGCAGFTLIELMIVVAIIGVLAAIAIPNFISMEDRAKEGSVKHNMHTFQLTAEDYGLLYDGKYSDTADGVAAIMPSLGATLINPFTHTIGVDVAWEDRSSISSGASATRGIVSYADSGNATYNIKAFGSKAPIGLILTSGN